MKKILYTLLISSVAFLHSCSQDDSLLFEQTTSERIAETVAMYDFALTNTGTWVMEYFPDKELSYGGWVYVLEFGAGNKIKAWFEGDTFNRGFLKEDDFITESNYKIEFSTGPMLKFTTHNDHLHYFAYPDANNGGYQGRRGDFEFTIMSISPSFDEIIMRGIRTGNRIRLTPLSGEYTPESYIESVRNDQLAIGNTSFRVTANGEEIATIQRSNRPYFSVFGQYASSKVWTINYSYQVPATGVDGQLLVGDDGEQLYETVVINDKLSVINLPDGTMKLYEPYVFKGDVIPLLRNQTMQTFVWTLGLSSALDCYVCQDSFFDIKFIP